MHADVRTHAGLFLFLFDPGEIHMQTHDANMRDPMHGFTAVFAVAKAVQLA